MAWRQDTEKIARREPRKEGCRGIQQERPGGGPGLKVMGPKEREAEGAGRCG